MNVLCIDCRRPVDDHGPNCECAMATDLIRMMGVPIVAVVFPVGALDPFLPGRHDVGYPKPEST